MQADVLVDFNDLDENGVLVMHADFVPAGIAVGDRLRAYDDDGSECVVEVQSVDGDLVRFRVIPGTFRSVES